MVSTERESWPGRKFGASRTGVGSVASTGRRVAAFVIDISLAALAGWVFTFPDPPQNLSLAIWGGITIVTVAVFGISPGHAAVGIRVASVRGALFVGFWAVPRTILVFLIVPPLIVDADGRGIHDRLCRTIVVTSR